MQDTAREGRTHKRCSSIDPFKQMCKCWMINKNLSTDICTDMECRLEDLHGVMDDRDE